MKYQTILQNEILTKISPLGFAKRKIFRKHATKGNLTDNQTKIFIRRLEFGFMITASSNSLSLEINCCLFKSVNQKMLPLRLKV